MASLSHRRPRSIPLYGLLLIAAPAFGILTRRRPDWFPGAIAMHAGDACWAMAAFFLFGLILRRSSTTRIALLAALLSLAVEVSQLFSFPWLDAARDHPLGALLLGRGFLWIDLPRYAAGVLLAAAIDRIIMRRSQ